MGRGAQKRARKYTEAVKNYDLGNRKSAKRRLFRVAAFSGGTSTALTRARRMGDVEVGGWGAARENGFANTPRKRSKIRPSCRPREGILFRSVVKSGATTQKERADVSDEPHRESSHYRVESSRVGEGECVIATSTQGECVIATSPKGSA